MIDGESYCCHSVDDADEDDNKVDDTDHGTDKDTDVDGSCH